ncbi:hypothetical protein ACQ4M3_17695 [Leptolyngbya sp. AN03gr2]|uniref:hypothetical protein n=1 Tax=unclassified Leptolyngbya TaxID=2650499 RepID=UPI003D312A23
MRSQFLIYGDVVGEAVGLTVGETVGETVGLTVGETVGLTVGETVGLVSVVVPPVPVPPVPVPPVPVPVVPQALNSSEKLNSDADNATIFFITPRVSEKTIYFLKQTDC